MKKILIKLVIKLIVRLQRKNSPMLITDDNIVRVWYNNKEDWFEVYMPDGTKIPKGIYTTVSDNFIDNMTVTHTMLCKYVIEQPKHKSSLNNVKKG